MRTAQASCLHRAKLDGAHRTRPWARALIAVALTAAMAGCARGPEAGRRSQVLSLFTWVPPAEMAVNQRLIHEFERSHPQVKVRMLNEPGGRAMDKLQASIAAGNAPDVMSVHGAFFIPLAAEGAFLPLDPLIKSDPTFDLADFYPQLVRLCRYKGTLYSLPRYTSVYVLFYNKALFEAAGIKYPDASWTWDDFLSAARALTRRSGDPSRRQFGCVVDVWSARTFPWIWQNGGEIVDRSGKTCLVDQPEAVGALQFLMDLRRKWRVTPTLTQTDFRETKEWFKAGRVGMFMSGAWDIQVFKQAPAFRWEVAPLPKKKTRATLLGMENYCISSSTRRQKLAWELFKFLLSRHAQAVMATQLDKQPSRRSVTQHVYLKQKVHYDRRVLVEALEYGRQAPNLPAWTKAEHYLREQLERMWQGEISVEQGARLAAQLVSQELSRTKSGSS